MDGRGEVFMATVMRNEAPYLLEFIAHYRLLGFDRVLIATNDNTDCTMALLERLREAGLCEFFEHSVAQGGHPQKNGYRLIWRSLRERFTDFHLYVVDADEFLVLERDRGIHDYLARFPGVDLICLNWRFFGSDGHLTRPPGLLNRAYTRHVGPAHRGNRTLKGLFRNSPNIRGFGAHFPHFDVLEGVRVTYSDGEPIDPFLLRGVTPHQKWATPNHGLAWVRHYGLKSIEEFAARRNRGSGRGAQDARYVDEYFARYDQNLVFDPFPAGQAMRLEAEMERLYLALGLSALAPRSYFGLRG